MAKSKKIDLENIPSILEKAMGLIQQQIDAMSKKDLLDTEDCKNLISFCNTASSIYKDYRAEVKQIEMELRGKSKQEILSLVKADL